MTTKEEEEKLKQDDNASDNEVKEDVPPDSPPLEKVENEEKRGRDVKKQKSNKRELDNESE